MAMPVIQAGGNYATKYFKKISELSIDELIALAKSLVGLKLMSLSGDLAPITSWDITRDVDAHSYAVQQDTKNNGVSVFIRFGSVSSVPIRDLNSYRIVYPALTEIVYLNDQYTAIVSKTHVEVGCQKFPIELVEEILAASKRIA